MSQQVKFDIDPRHELEMKLVEGGKDVICKYKGKRISALEMIDIQEERYHKAVEGKDPAKQHFFVRK